MLTISDLFASAATVRGRYTALRDRLNERLGRKLDYIARERNGLQGLPSDAQVKRWRAEEQLISDIADAQIEADATLDYQAELMQRLRQRINWLEKEIGSEKGMLLIRIAQLERELKESRANEAYANRLLGEDQAGVLIWMENCRLMVNALKEAGLPPVRLIAPPLSPGYAPTNTNG